jgi:FMN-dependent NADH-azoreductase
MQLLHVDSSITGDHSVSRRLSAAVVARLRELAPHLAVVRRDLAADPLPHFAAEHLAGVGVRPEPGAAAEPGGLRLDARVLGEFMDADVVVVGAPMYNFGIPSQLKAWVDRLAVAGATFRYTPQGPVGLAGGKRVIIASSRGGFYGPGSPAAAAEHHESYLQATFRFFGVADVTVIRAEGVRVSPEARRDAVDAALAAAAALDRVGAGVDDGVRRLGAVA